MNLRSTSISRRGSPAKLKKKRHTIDTARRSFARNGSHVGGCRKRRREISAQDIAILPIEEFSQEQSTKGSYSCYIQPYVQFAIDNGWTSEFYPEAMKRSVLTEEYVQENKIKPICSPAYIEAYLKVFHQNGRRRVVGVVSKSMADQVMKAVSNQRLLEICKKIPHLQTAEWRSENPEYMSTACKVLRSQTIVNLLKDFGRRQTADNQLRCVDTKKFKEHLNSEELIAESRWAWRNGTPDHHRIHSVLTLGRSTAFRSESMLDLKNRDLKAGILGSNSCGTPEYPVLECQPYESKENHLGIAQTTGCMTTGCMMHVNPMICPIAALRATLLTQHLIWNIMEPRLEREIS
jgi:hypothetical protein